MADPAFNAEQTSRSCGRPPAGTPSSWRSPELGLSAYSCDDLFQQQALLDESTPGLSEILTATRDLPVIGVVGLPLKIGDALFNCAAVISQGRIFGVVPKTYLPNYREYYELRQFAPGDRALKSSVDILGQRDVPFGNRLLFRVDDQPLFTFGVEICEDLWVPIPPSSYAALAGATVLVNLSASNVTVTKGDYRRQLVSNQSARCLAAYLYTAAGFGESTTDLAWDGQAIICENGTLLAESRKFAYGSQFVTADVDLDRLSQERMRQVSFGQTAERHRTESKGIPYRAPCRPISLAADGFLSSASMSGSPLSRPIPKDRTTGAKRSIRSRFRGS